MVSGNFSIIGSGPAGLFAAQILAQKGVKVSIYEALDGPGKKFLRAGRGGLNLTHNEDLESFLSRYGEARAYLEEPLRAFGPQELRAWAEDLDIHTFVGTSGRVFPKDFDAQGVLNAWLDRLASLGVELNLRWRWEGWTKGNALKFSTPQGLKEVNTPGAVLALGGASWPGLGTGGTWAPILKESGLELEPFKSANCGFNVPWSSVFREKFALKPVKALGIRGRVGEIMITAAGVEGGLIYAFSADFRRGLEHQSMIEEPLDLAPGRSLSRLIEDLSQPRGGKSLSTFLQSRLGLSPVKVALLREFAPSQCFENPRDLALWIKALPLKLSGVGPLATAISCAGGLKFSNLDKNLMIRQRPGVFCAGEMLDWEAPTGGYLLTACFSLGRWAGLGAAQWLRSQGYAVGKV